jgi:hypothetical protein
MYIISHSFIIYSFLDPCIFLSTLLPHNEGRHINQATNITPPKDKIACSHGDEQENGCCWNVSPCTLVDIDESFGEHTASIIRTMTEALSISETSASI